jgi:hypothetical protein
VSRQEHSHSDGPEGSDPPAIYQIQKDIKQLKAGGWLVDNNPLAE